MLVLVLALGSGCGGREEPPTAERASPVYRLELEELPDDPDCEDPSCRIVRIVLWVAPEEGAVRLETADATGFETTRIFADGTLVTDHGDGSPNVRSGLASFVGRPPEAAAVAAIRTSGDVAVGDRIAIRFGRSPRAFIVEAESSLDEPEVERLFDVPRSGTISRAVEPGTPSGIVDAYWLGHRFENLAAVAAVERQAGDGDAYSVFYDRAGEANAPDAPEDYGAPGQLQISSQDRGAALRRTLDAVAGRERFPVTLTDGQRATFIVASAADATYVVVTRTALIGFSGVSRAEAVRIAEALRRIRQP